MYINKIRERPQRIPLQTLLARGADRLSGVFNSPGSSIQNLEETPYLLDFPICR